MRRNRFEAFCGRCGLTVPPGAGPVANVGGKWVVKHDYCADLDRSAHLVGVADDNDAVPFSAARDGDFD